MVDLENFEITTIGDPLLSRPSSPLTNADEASEIFARLTYALRKLGGAGLAAPQIGVGIAAAVIEVRKTELYPDRPESPHICIANPEVLSISDTYNNDWEGCFSIPDLFGVVPRPDRIELKYRDENWQEVTSTFEGYLARVVQHEIDHLQGRNFPSRMSSLDSLATQENFVKIRNGK